MTTGKCTNKGCGKVYSEGSCDYHPGAPVFHEGLKGWSCCSKRTVDFDEFLQIKGCTLGMHSLEKKVEPTPQKEKDIAPTRVDCGIFLI